MSTGHKGSMKLLTRALAKNKKNTRPLQHKFKFSAIICLKQATVEKVTIGSDETIIISNVYQLGQNVVKYIVHAANTNVLTNVGGIMHNASFVAFF